MRRFLLSALIALMALPAAAYETMDAHSGIPAPRVLHGDDAKKDGAHKDGPKKDSKERRCTTDGLYCIEIQTYIPDVCRTIEQASAKHGVDPHFLARLLWKESLFEPNAISPVGAQGIAQFMPGTADLVGLDDPFNPAKAIDASAGYLRRLTDNFGSIGMAAIAYNGGENRAARFKGGASGLPWETQDYVQAITGLDAAEWRDNPPTKDKLDIRLDKEKPFIKACTTLAGNRKLREFSTPEHAWPFGVILASHPSKSGASAQVDRLNRQLRPILGGKRVSYVRRRLTGSARKLYTAQLGYSNQAEAVAFCTRLRGLGGRCIVLKN
ncbi:lytic transglycosylase domain-containing protein [Paracoccus aminophilus]|uniref:Lytic transglycosylase n=1 Tax=Paracoccus aminophilus JCM 7686 TaxID=1367847 RepID=S5YYD0_PARAH|nr:lytic transglycosylase domain-containing protein [Paracoccus aminophilus]AGT10196.1 lytic transglycosylase [Paracoccus aminophilus JCM 7686]